jgi:hypothetical protein
MVRELSWLLVFATSTEQRVFDVAAGAEPVRESCTHVRESELRALDRSPLSLGFTFLSSATQLLGHVDLAEAQVARVEGGHLSI